MLLVVAIIRLVFSLMFVMAEYYFENLGARVSVHLELSEVAWNDSTLEYIPSTTGYHDGSTMTGLTQYIMYK